MSEGKPITEMWAWVVTHPDGAEGVPASSGLMPGMMMPLIGADEQRIRSLEIHARSIAALMGLPLELRRFTTMETVEVLN